MDTFLQIALSVAFLLPGYIVFKAKQSVAFIRTPSKFELIIQTVIYSIIIFALFLIIPFCRNTIFDFDSSKPITQIITLRSSPFIFTALLYLCALTATTAVISMAIRYRGWWRKLTLKAGFKLFDEYETPWEQFVHLATIDQWLEVELTNGEIYQGKLLSVAVPPYETELILQYCKYKEEEIPVRVYDKEYKRILKDSFIEYAIVNLKDIRVARVVRGSQPPEKRVAELKEEESDSGE